MANIPPPPVGFALDAAPPTPEPSQYIPIPQSNVPAPPTGFTLDQPQPGNTNTGVGRLIANQSGASVGQRQDGSVSADNASRSIAAGVPIIGGLLNSVDAATNAALAPYIDPLLPDSFQKLPGSTFDERYQQALDIQNGKSQAFHQQHPYVDTGMQIAGGVGAAIPAVAAAPALFGAAEGSLPARALAGAFGGSGIGAADAITRTDGNPQSVAIGAGLGGILGAAGPAAGEIVGNIYRNAATNAVQNSAADLAGVSRPAVDTVARALAADNTIGNSGANIAAAGPRAMLADAGPSTLSVLDTAIQRAGPGAGQAAQRVGQRAAGATNDINQAMDAAFGPDQGMLAPLDAIRNSTQPARQAAYDAAYSQPINYASPQGQTLQNIIETRVPQSAINAANNLMRVEGNSSKQILANVADDGSVTFQRLPDVRQIDYITRGLNQVADEANGQGALGGTTPIGRAYGDLSGTIRKLLGSDALVPKYKTALDTAAAPIQQREAMQFGQTMLSPSVSRDEVAAFTNGLTDAQNASVRSGVRSQIGEALANVKRAASDPSIDARQGVQAIRDMSSDAAREKISAVLGPNEANSFFNAMDQAARSFNLRAGVTTNSRTYARQAAEQSVNDLTAPGVLETAAAGKPLEAGKTLAQKLLGTGPAAQLGRKDAAWSDIANLLTQPVNNMNSPFFQAINSAANRLPAIDATANALTRAGGAVTGVFAPLASRLGVQEYQRRRYNQ